MSSKLPNKFLVNVLQQNSRQTLERHAQQLAAAAVNIPAEAIQTRFLRNHFLISPKSLCLLGQGEVADRPAPLSPLYSSGGTAAYDPEDYLSRWHLFAVYKPPFCPMHRADAADNYHRVSVESFVVQALRSRNLAPQLRELFRTPAEMHVRVLNDVDRFGSGPVVVSVSDRFPFATSLVPFRMTYDLLVHGHLPLTEAKKTIEPSLLFPAQAERLGDAAPTSATMEVKRNGYYASHAVSLLEVVIASPPTALPPALTAYVREQLQTFVVGDPVAMESIVLGGGAASAAPAAAEGPGSAAAALTLQGDVDFPRVFHHLREVAVEADVTADGSPPAAAAAPAVRVKVPLVGGAAATPSASPASPTGKEVISFHCRKCFDKILHTQRITHMKRKQMGLLDGQWTPATEYVS
ncbi:hypothetical protein STCU_06916 [Strigomonas culicis]|uniref:Uncharacterized protein n=1 Tax=Strigomonas culicis TaxID=28005 RepID=S9U823_9TRYP|nr:hypothetical protein STCU_06916 [Strigomonas culicis]|eukprot:EPY24964.1 hypothetical protein STCU_06916 [Strigomonas culicis]